MKLLALPLVAVTAAVAPLPFRSVAQRAALGEDPAKPAVYLATKPADIAAFSQLLRTEDRPRLRTVRLAERAIVAVFLGAKVTGGYVVSVKRLSVASGRLTVTALVTAPGPDDIVIQAFTSPYHVVTAARSLLGAKLPTVWKLADETGRTLATGAFRR